MGGTHPQQPEPAEHVWRSPRGMSLEGGPRVARCGTIRDRPDDM
jgi:hypothetical protein